MAYKPRRCTTEPVLRDLASRIAAEEANHYKHFYRFFRRYREAERVGCSRAEMVAAGAAYKLSANACGRD